MKSALTLFVVLLALTTLSAQGYTFRLTTEGGLYRDASQQSEALGRLHLKGKYDFQSNAYYVRVTGAVIPERVDFNGRQSSIKLNMRLAIGNQKQKKGWEGSLQTRHYYYTFSNADPVSISMAVFGLSAYRRPAGWPLIGTRVEYLYRDQSTQPSSRLDAGRVTTGPHVFIGSWRLQPALSLERFKVHSPKISITNNGWRAGLELNLSHRGEIHLQASAGLLTHHSDMAREAGREWHLQLISGTFLAPKWALFAFVEYRSSRLNNITGPEELRYTTFENENWIYLKLEYDVAKGHSVFARGGYFKDTFPGQNSKLSGTQFLLGYSWKTP